MYRRRAVCPLGKENAENGLIKPVNDISLEIPRGKVVGIVGESGCGKSMTAMSVMQLLQHPGKVVAGTIELEGENLLDKTEREMCDIRGNKISM
ncbi:MAG: ATP-binding cassette domain-containing protein, partial [Solobacterium sp.]|nr:ATP-binding cassette domain-containing protein [Solobacterium sp.]